MTRNVETFHPGVPMKVASALLFVLLTGCAAPRPDPVSFVPPQLPPEALVTQRVVLTARGRQFALNGYLAVSEKGGRRLMVAQSFGQVVADLLIQRDGTVQVLKSSPMVRPEWIERCVAGDLQCLLGDGSPENCSIRSLGPSHYLIKRRWYELDLQIVEIKPGPQPAELFDPTRSVRP